MLRDDFPVPSTLRVQHFFVKIIVAKSCFVNLPGWFAAGKFVKLKGWFPNSVPTSGLSCLFSNLDDLTTKMNESGSVKYDNRTMNTNEINDVCISIYAICDDES